MSARSHFRVHVATFALTALCVVTAGRAATPAPGLPTPCAGASCGANAQSFATYGAATVSSNGTTMNINQSTDKAILNWANFNIAQGNTVNFNQPGKSSATLNNIWSADPSRIAGQLNANGQIYLYNQNGIVFDKGAQVNVGGLTASTLKLSEDLFKNGILSGNSASGIPCSLGSSPCQPAVFQGDNAGSVEVAAGATLKTSDGGRIMLLGTKVTNQGQIDTPNGQTVLGAGKQVYLAASNDPSMRGLLIEVDGGGSADNSTVTNAGQITATRGNVTLAGLIVNQEGRVTATTSVSANGSIYLVAGDTSAGTPFYKQIPTDANGKPTAFGGLLPNNGGTLTLAPGSVTEVLPDANETATINKGNLTSFIPSEVDLVGKTVTLQGNAQVHAPGAKVNVSAAADPWHQLSNVGQAQEDDGSRIYMDSGSSIDVSGLTNVPVAVTRNLVNVRLESNDLQDDPLLRDGFLHGLDVTIDISRPLPKLFNATSYVANIPLTLSEVLTSAGTIALRSRGDVVTRAGSTLNVSGGSVAYQGGFGPSTTKLIGADGKVYDIGTAPNSIQYVGVANSYSYTDPTWGTKTSGSASTYHPGYVEGRNAGEIDVSAPRVYLRGNMQAQTVAGPFQRTAATLAQGGTLLLGCATCKDGENLAHGLTGGVILADGIVDDLVGDAFTITDVPQKTLLSPWQLYQSGFSTLNISTDGALSLPEGQILRLPAFGRFIANSLQSITIDGKIDAPGGTVSLTTVPINNSDATPHDIKLGSSAAIDVAGRWINDSPLVTTLPGTAPEVINGGTVNLTAYGNVLLGAGSRIDVSGGGWIDSSNRLSAGDAGAIGLSASYKTDFSLSKPTPILGVVDLGFGTDLTQPGATLLGASLAGAAGGSLSIKAGSVTIGNSPSGTIDELFLTPDFFNNRGFGSYSLTGSNGLVIGSADPNNHDDVRIAPVRENLVLDQSSLLKVTGTDLSTFTQLQLLPPSLRSAVNLSFAASGNTGFAGTGSVLLSQNATIDVQPGANSGGTVSLTGGNFGNLTVLGSILAPAGKILLQIGNPGEVDTLGDLDYVPSQQILLGSHALLSATGYAQINTLNTLGYRQGSVLDGGTVSVQANRGYIVAETGSSIDVSGAAGVVDIPISGGVKAATVAGGAGSINIDAREGMVLHGELHGEAASSNGAPVAGAGGGSLSVGLDLFHWNSTRTANQTNPEFPLPTDRTLTLTGDPASSTPVTLQKGSARISAETLQSGGFDNITVKSSDILALDGTFSLTAKSSLTLDAPLLQGTARASATLSAAHVTLGNYANFSGYLGQDNAAALDNPAVAAILHANTQAVGGGTAQLAVNAQLIDIRGQSGWIGFSKGTLSSSGDIRFASALNPGSTVTGTYTSGLNTAADLTFQSAQSYPTTATSFTLNTSGSVTFDRNPGASSTPATPLSAGGTLKVNALNILQAGVLRAPLGDIELNGVDQINADTGAIQVVSSVTLARDSLTSVSADGLIIPYGSVSNGGSSANGIQWTYSPSTDITNALAAPPAKQVKLSGSHVDVQGGAKVDLSGGGDLYAAQFIAGPGGSKDVLSATNGTYTYAIVPSRGGAFAPIDAQYQQGSKATGSQSIYLSGVPGLTDGYYALLPAYYALLPGAYAVQVTTRNSDLAAGSAVKRPDGAYVTAARFGVSGTDVLDSRTSTVVLAPGSVVRSQSQYSENYANAFFSSAAAAANTATPSLPADAGQLTLTSHDMTLDGTFAFTPSSYTSGTDSAGKPITHQGLGGGVSILASKIVVADCSTAASAECSADDTLYLNAQSLDNLHAQTLVLGATLANTSDGEAVTVSSSAPTQSVTLTKTSVPLVGPEIILAATDQILVEDGAQLQATGTYTGSTAPLFVQGAGALLRASSGGSAALKVDTKVEQNMSGLVSIGASSLTADGSLQLYTTKDLTVAPKASIAAANLGLYSNHILVGDAPSSAAATGLNLTSALLNNLGAKLTGLTLGSQTSIDFYGGVNLGGPGSASPNLVNLTLDARVLGGYGTGGAPANVTLQAGAVAFTNSTGESATADQYAGTGGAGTFSLIAKTVSGQADSGQLTLGTAGTAPGDQVISGFSAVNLLADADIAGNGGTLTMANGSAPVSVSMTGARLVVASGADQKITAGGAVTLASSGAAAAAASNVPPLGGKLTIEGSEIAQNGDIELPAGIVTLHASGAGGVTLGANSKTNTPGAAKLYYDTYGVAAGGTINLIADNGNITIAGGALLNVSGATSADGKAAGDAGTLRVLGPRGSFTYSGATIKGGAADGQTQGNFTLDEQSGLGGTLFSNLNGMLASGGFKGAVALRSRGDSAVTIASTDSVKASSFMLEADQGTIDIGGTIDTSGGSRLNTDGGSISIWAINGLTLESTAVLHADAGKPGPKGADGTARAAHGGDIALGSSSGYINFVADGSNKPLVTMVGGGAFDTDGTLTLRAPRTAVGTTTADGANVQITSTGLEVDSRKPVVIEGVQTVVASMLAANDDPLNAQTLGVTADPGNTLYASAKTFIDGAATDAAALHLTAGNAGKGQTGAQVRAGIEVDSLTPDPAVPGSGDLQLASDWDLSAWSTALGAPVNVTLRAAGNLILNGSLSDGFSTADTTGTLTGCAAGVACTASYRLTGGADLSAANPLAVNAQPLQPVSTSSPEGIPNSGNVIITPDKLIRTGNGNIDVAAGGDVLLGYQYNGYDATTGNLQVSKPTGALTSVIYTAGIPSLLSTDQQAQFTAPDGASYATGGGNITVTASDDIRSAPSAQVSSAWLWRRSNQSGDPNATTTWWVMFNNFKQGIGALGGGDIELNAGRDIVNVSAVIPTTGRVIGADSAAQLVLAGGGNLLAQAGGDLKSGVFEVDQGNALIRAGGALNSGTTIGEEVPNGTFTPDVPADTPVYPVLLLSSGLFDVTARGTATINLLGSSTTTIEWNPNKKVGITSSYFYTYGPSSAVNLQSVGGDVVMLNTGANLPFSVLTGNSTGSQTYEKRAYVAINPPTLNLTALSGSLDLRGDFNLFPSATGNLNLLATKDIGNKDAEGFLRVTMFESDPTLLPNPFAPLKAAPTSVMFANADLPLVPLHQQDDGVIHVVAESGDISKSKLTFPKAAEVVAGNDIGSLDYNGKNLRPSDVTLIQAGGDIFYPIKTEAVTNAPLDDITGITIGGPGYLEVLAGGTLNLGISHGLDTSGNLFDSRLSSTGAALVVGAGFGKNDDGTMRQPALQPFIDKYLTPDPKGNPSAYATPLINFLKSLYPDSGSVLTYSSALTQFNGLTRGQQLPFVSQVLTEELNQAGLAYTKTGLFSAYDQGYTAINTLFPTKDAQGKPLSYKGDINMFFSALRTEQGGDISLLAPGGSVVVGLADPPTSVLNKHKSQSTTSGTIPAEASLGMLVFGTGAIKGFADQSFTVNQSRILTLEGGDIVLWASNGDIDAGRGAKSASAAPPPIIQIDEQGGVHVNPSNAVVGSGIGQLVSTPGIKPGNVNLIAPKGAVNAGDAGIRVAGNLNIAAQVVIGASNITVNGTATGVPTSDAGALSGALSGASALGDAGKNAVDQLNQNLSQAGNFQELSESLTPTFIQVKMFCLGVECETR